MILLAQYLKANRIGLLVWTLAHMTLILMVAASATAIETQTDYLFRAFSEWMPRGLQSFLGLAPGMSKIDSYIQAKTGALLSLTLPIYATLLAAGVVTREVDSGTADFLLALPTRRRDIMLSRWVGMCLNLAALAVTSWGAVVLGLKAKGLTGSFYGYFWMCINCFLLAVAIGSINLAASVWINDYSSGVRILLAVVVGLFFVDLGVRIADLPYAARFFNPFSHYDPAYAIKNGGMPAGSVLTLLFMSAASLIVAVKKFDEKQIET